MNEELVQSRRAGQRALALALAITASLLVAEVVAGILTNSLALLADAGHMVSDVGALSLSIFAIWAALRPASATRTYGLQRVEILAALVNGLTLVLIALYIFWEAGHRFGEPPEVSSLPMLGVAVGGLVANVVSGLILYRYSAQSLNVRGAYFHVLGDALGSVGVIAAAIIMLSTGWFLADPLISVLIGLLILYSSWRLLRESVEVLLEAVPSHIDANEVESTVKGVPGVTGVHDLHIWTVTSGLVSLSCHCELDASRASEQVLSDLFGLLHERFGIRHVTIQPETHAIHGELSSHTLPRCVSIVGDGVTGRGGS
jgi:cobalt-zinc-cadmium efflux system protein